MILQASGERTGVEKMASSFVPKDRQELLLRTPLTFGFAAPTDMYQPRNSQREVTHTHTLLLHNFVCVCVCTDNCKTSVSCGRVERETESIDQENVKKHTSHWYIATIQTKSHIIMTALTHKPAFFYTFAACAVYILLYILHWLSPSSQLLYIHLKTMFV